MVSGECRDVHAAFLTIKDQVDELRSHLGFKGVVGLTGQATVAEKTESIRDLSEGRIRLLYVSPERLVNDPGLQGALANITLGCLVVDEAHCVHDWAPFYGPYRFSTRVQQARVGMLT